MNKFGNFKKHIKHGKLKIKKGNVKKAVIKKLNIPDFKRAKICKKARKSAHKPVPNARRDLSNSMRKGILENIPTLSESYGMTFDFIEEDFGYGCSPLDTIMYESPKEDIIFESNEGKKVRRGIIGEARGIFQPIGTMSRNGRIYESDHWDYVLENTNVANKIKSRGMGGCIGHRNKKVDDADYANGEVSHVVSDLEVVEDGEGNRFLYGILEILDNEAGRRLKTYYDAGMPMYVSSRGGGVLLPVEGKKYKKVDKTKYVFETFDIVHDPGFLEARPSYVLNESLQENKESNMTTKDGNVKTDIQLDSKMSAEEIVAKMLTPIKEQLEELTKKIESLDKVNEENKEEVDKEADKEEDKAAEKLDADAKEAEKAEENKEVETTDEGKDEDKKEEAEKAEENKEVETTDEGKDEDKKEEAEKLEADEKDDKAKAGKLEADSEKVDEGCDKKEEKVVVKKEEEEQEEQQEEQPEKEVIDKELIKKLEEERDSSNKLAEEATALSNQLMQTNEALEKELNAYKLSDEFGISKAEATEVLESVQTLDEAKQKLTKTEPEEVVDESNAIEETPKTEEVIDEAKVESDKRTKAAKRESARLRNIFGY